MQDRLTEGYLAYAEGLDGVAVVPAGEAFRRVWSDDPEGRFRQLYAGDGSHPSPYGTFLIAATAHSALTGRDPAEVDPGWKEADAAELEALREVVRGLVLADPFGPYGYPWASDWVDGTAQVGAAGVRPVVRVQGVGTSGDLTVGGLDEGLPADGELWIGADGSLDVGTLSVGVDGTAVVDVDGVLAADLLRVGVGATWAWSGVVAPGAVDGDLVQDGGTLRAAVGLDIAGTWTVVEGALDVVAWPTEPGEHVLVVADAIEADGLEPLEGVEVVPQDGRQALVLTVPETSEGDAGSRTAPADGEAQGCGCSSASWGPVWQAALLSRRSR